MSQIDVSIVFEFLQAKWKDRPCPMCGQDSWSIQQGVFALLELHEKGVAIGSSSPSPVHPAAEVVPVVPVVCKSCGNTVLVNAIVADIIKEEAKHA